MQATMLYGARGIRLKHVPTLPCCTPRTPSSESPRPPFATLICGPTGAYRASRRPRPWATNTVASLKPWAAPCSACGRGSHAGYVGVPHGVSLSGEALFFKHVHLHGGPAPARQYLPHLLGLALENKLRPGQVFDLHLPLDQVAEGYRAMDERRAIKTLRQIS
jgi:D-arabinose 1-dehydrogenase-like Zn-dependent alcohol dehydrogenase